MSSIPLYGMTKAGLYAGIRASHTLIWRHKREYIVYIAITSMIKLIMYEKKRNRLTEGRFQRATYKMSVWILAPLFSHKEEHHRLFEEGHFWKTDPEWVLEMDAQICPIDWPCKQQLQHCLDTDFPSRETINWQRRRDGMIHWISETLMKCGISWGLTAQEE